MYLSTCTPTYLFKSVDPGAFFETKVDYLLLHTRPFSSASDRGKKKPQIRNRNSLPTFGFLPPFLHSSRASRNERYEVDKPCCHRHLLLSLMIAPQDAQRPGAAGEGGAGSNREIIQADTKKPSPHEGGREKDDRPAVNPPSSPTSSIGTPTNTKILQFLSTATPGALGGAAAALALFTYLILGQIGLVLIGAVSGAVAVVQWEGQNPDISRAIKGERGIHLLEKLLETSANRKAVTNAKSIWQSDWNDEDENSSTSGIDGFRPETQAALNELVDAVIRDYVKWWYSPIVPSDRSFPLACRKTLNSFLLSVSTHLSRKRPADAFLDLLTNTSSIVIVFFSELSNAFAELPSDPSISAHDVVSNYLAVKPNSNLSNLVNRTQQAARLRAVAEDLLTYLESSTSNCDPARFFLREILASAILEMTIQTCSKPEWINGWIVYLLEAGEPDFNQAIDVGMKATPNSDNTLVDIDGNVGNIGLSKGNRNSHDAEKSRRKIHRKESSSADEQTEIAMEEMKRMNQMIADEEARRAALTTNGQSSAAPATIAEGQPCKEPLVSTRDASDRLTDALKRNADDLDMKDDSVKILTGASALPQQPLDTEGKESPRKGDGTRTPVTPVSYLDSSSQASSPKQSIGSRFTSFDQIVPPGKEDPDIDGEPRSPLPLTLHNATVTVLDEPGDKTMRTRPSWDYLIQIEPATAQHPGWMVVRKYSDFEPLHEILRRIATVSGATSFTEQHNTLPSWKIHTRSSLRGELERYLREACCNQSLAESEGLKKFLEKGQQFPQPNSKSGLQAFEKIGKNVFDVIASAPAEGSKVVVGGVTGVLGNMGLGQKKPQASSSLQDVTAASRLSISTPPRVDSWLNLNGARKRDSLDSQRSSVVSTQPSKAAPMGRQPSYNSQGEMDGETPPLPLGTDRWERPLLSRKSSREASRPTSLAPLHSPSATSLEGIKLPPPPDAMPDDYESPRSSGTRLQDTPHLPSLESHGRSQTMPDLSHISSNSIAPQRPQKSYSPLSEQEARVAVDLTFAVINELYSLSSAWNIRRTLLAAAKTFFLRPGNPSLTSIQSMIQSSVIEANTSDSGIATHLKKLRENTLPTDEERDTWPAEMSTEEKEKLRIKARKLFIECGVPVALSGVMGQSASSEALGRIFDCLQIEEVARALMFGVMIQAVKVITD